MKLEVKVLDYINHHHHGVRISEMEIPLGETRMKLGFIAKNLLYEGKILKLSNNDNKHIHFLLENRGRLLDENVTWSASAEPSWKRSNPTGFVSGITGSSTASVGAITVST